MPGISQLTTRGQWHTTSAGRHPTQKLFSTLKSAFLCSCISKNAVIECKTDKNISAQDVEMPEEIIAVPTVLDTTDDEQNQLPGVNRLQSPTDSEDDDISVISLGEARRLAQLRIDGVAANITTTTVPNNRICDTLSRATPSSVAPSKITLPPIEPIYRKKAVSKLRKVLRQRKVGDTSVALNKKQTKQQKKEAKKEAKEKKQQLKRSKKMEKLTSWLEETKKKIDPSATTKTLNKGNEALIAKEHSKIADLHKSISDMEQKRKTKQQKITELMEIMEKEGEDLKFDIKKLVKCLKRTDAKIRRLKAEVLTREEKIKQLSPTVTQLGTDQPAINECGQTMSDNRAVSNTNNSLVSTAGDGKLNPVTVTRGPKVKVVKPHTPSSSKMFLSRPSTAVRRFTMGPDTTTVTARERMVKEMMKIEEKVQEAMFQRPRAAHPSRVRSVTENVQEFLPYDLEHCDSDSDDEDTPSRRHIVWNSSNQQGAEGMKKFEELQRSKSGQRVSKSVHSVSNKTDVDLDDDFDFLSEVDEVATPSVRPPTRCRNPVAKQLQMLHTQQTLH